MLIPTNSSAVTPEWLEKVLKLKILPDTFKLISNAEDGSGYLSEMARVEFREEIETENGQGHGHGRLHNLILKLLPPVEKSSRNMVRLKNLDQVETIAYQILFPELIKIIPELDEYLCQLVYSEIQVENEAENIPYASVLILEDLKSFGYFMVHFGENIGESCESYFRQGLDFLAKFHAASIGLEEKRNSRLLEIFDWLPKKLVPPGKTAENRPIPGFQTRIPGAFKQIIQMLKENEETASKFEIIETLANLEMNSEIVQEVLKAGQKYPCVLHGDLWTHNILVKDTEGSIKLKFLDWQGLAYGDPAFDLGVYILECLPNLTKENVLNWVKLYYENYVLDCFVNRLGLKMKCKRNYTEFEEFYKTYGLSYCLMWFVLCCVNMLNLPNYPAKILKIFKVIKEFGVFEFLAGL